MNSDVKDKTTRDAYGSALLDLGKGNHNIVAVDADLSKCTMSCKFAKEFPERFFNLGVSEQDVMGTAAGLAVAGKIPFASTFAVFAAGRAYDQIRVSIAYSGLNVKVVGSHGGIGVGEDGPTHHAIEDIALMRAMPGMIVVCPSDGISAYRATEAVASYVGPVYLRTTRNKLKPIYDLDYKFKIGKADVLMYSDTDVVTIVSTGIMASFAKDACETLRKKDVNVRLINMQTVKPLDAAVLLKAAKETKGIITCEDHSVIGGLGGAVAEFLSEHCPTKLLRIGVKDMFTESGTATELYKKYGLDAEGIEKQVEGFVRGI